jgi:uncharacterized protein DUF3551
MRLPILSLVVAVCALAGAGQTASAQSAYSYPWCAKYYGKLEGTACYYKSYQQCMTTVSGVGGYCYESPYYHAEPGARAPHVRR